MYTAATKDSEMRMNVESDKSDVMTRFSGGFLGLYTQLSLIDFRSTSPAPLRAESIEGNNHMTQDIQILYKAHQAG